MMQIRLMRVWMYVCVYNLLSVVYLYSCIMFVKVSHRRHGAF